MRPAQLSHFLSEAKPQDGHVPEHIIHALGLVGYLCFLSASILFPIADGVIHDCLIFSGVMFARAISVHAHKLCTHLADLQKSIGQHGEFMKHSFCALASIVFIMLASIASEHIIHALGLVGYLCILSASILFPIADGVIHDCLIFSGVMDLQKSIGQHGEFMKHSFFALASIVFIMLASIASSSLLLWGLYPDPTRDEYDEDDPLGQMYGATLFNNGIYIPMLTSLIPTAAVTAAELFDDEHRELRVKHRRLTFSQRGLACVIIGTVLCASSQARTFAATSTSFTFYIVATVFCVLTSLLGFVLGFSSLQLILSTEVSTSDAGATPTHQAES